MRGRLRSNDGTRRALIAVAAVLLTLAAAGCGEKETVVAGSLPTAAPSPQATGVIDGFRRSSGGDELVALERDPDLIGFPGDADSVELNGSADLLALDSESGPVTSSGRYGSFLLNVVARDGAFDVLLSDAAGDPLERGADGIYWERIATEGVGGDEIVNWIAHKRYGEVVLSRRSGEREVDSTFMRLDRVLSELVGPKGGGGGQRGPERPRDLAPADRSG